MSTTATITARNINSKIRPGLSQLMKKKPNDKRVTITYYLLIGEASKKYEDTLLLLEETLRDGGHADYCLIRNDAAEPGGMQEDMEYFRLPQRAMIALLRAMSPNFDELAAAADKPTYDPSKQYVLDRSKVGRPRRVLSDKERADIRRLRKQGMGINRIAKTLGINNRRVMEYCEELGYKSLYCNNS